MSKRGKKTPTVVSFTVKKVPDFIETKNTSWQFNLKRTLASFAVLAMVVQFGLPLMAQAAPVWPTTWTTPAQCTTDPAGDENPNETDIIGDSNNPGVGFSSDSNFLYFRERVDGDPGSAANPHQYAWVVLFQTTKPEYQYLGSVNGKDNKVQLWRNTTSAGAVDFSPLLNDPAEDMLFETNSSSNVRVTNAGGSVYYVDWAMPVAWFSGTGITIDSTKFFATSANANNYNKDHLDCYNILADLGLTKTVDKSTANEGDTLTYTITVTNGGADTAATTVVSDLVPTGTTYVSSNPSQGTYNSGTGVWTIGTLTNTQAVTLTLVVTVNSGTGGTTITNTATASAQTTDPDHSNNTASAQTDIDALPTTGTLKVIKQVTNNNGGEKTPSNFNIHVKSGNSDVAGSPQVGNASGTVYTLAGGSYTVSEDADSGYTADFSQCGSSGSVTVVNGQQTICTITNNDKQASLTVIKIVTKDNGGTAVPADFTMNVSGTGVSDSSFSGADGEGTTVTLDAGIFSVTEQDEVNGKNAGYSVSYDNCSGTIANGESKTCTITNNDIRPKLTVVKVVDNGDNENPLNSSDFTITVTGGPTSVSDFPGSGNGTVLNVDAGTYTVSEIVVENYEKSYNVCNLQGAITLAVGDELTCTITNTFQRPPPKTGTLKVVKNVINDNGGTASSSAFAITVTATNANPSQFSGSEDGVIVTAEVGSYSVVEAGVVDGKINGYAVTYDNCTGDILDGQEQICTITNDDISPKLTVTKEVVNLEGGSAVISDFILSVGSTTVTTGIQNEFSAGGYQITETGTDGYVASYEGNCDAQGNITLELAGTYTCTITNTYSSQNADLAVVKNVDLPVAPPGSTVVFTTVVTNNGPDLGKDVLVSDILPAGLTYVSSTSTAGSFDDNTSVWTIGNLPVGESVTLVITATVNNDATGTLTNTATVTGSVPDPNPDNNTDDAAVTTTYTLTLTKNGDGNGTVDGSVSGATSTSFCALDECRSTDEKQSFMQIYAAGTEVTLTANPAEGSNFNSSYSGACTGSNPSCSITMNQNQSVNAHFALNLITPPPSPSGGGTSPFIPPSLLPPAPPVPQVLGITTGLTAPPAPQVLGATTLPRTGVDLGFMGLMILGAMVIADRKFKLV